MEYLDYAAYRSAAEREGLGPMMERLTAEGIEHRIGDLYNALVICVPLTGDLEMRLTTEMVDSSDWCAAVYDSGADDEAELGWHLPTDDVIRRIRSYRPAA
jgi:hypothetical protein